MKLERGAGIEPTPCKGGTLPHTMCLPGLERTQGVEPCTHSLEGWNVPTNTWLALPLILALSACSQAPIVHIQYIKTPVYVPYPVTLVAPVRAVLPLGVTWGEALGITTQALQTCNGQLDALKGITPP